MAENSLRGHTLLPSPGGPDRIPIAGQLGTRFTLTNSGITSARLYWESKLAFFAPKGVSIPVAVSVFPDGLYEAPRSWAERAYPRLIHYNRLAAGGHFAAWEQPQFLSQDLREGFKTLR